MSMQRYTQQGRSAFCRSLGITPPFLSRSESCLIAFSSPALLSSKILSEAKKPDQSSDQSGFLTSHCYHIIGAAGGAGGVSGAPVGAAGGGVIGAATGAAGGGVIGAAAGAAGGGVIGATAGAAGGGVVGAIWEGCTPGCGAGASPCRETHWKPFQPRVISPPTIQYSSPVEAMQSSMPGFAGIALIFIVFSP